MTHPVNGASVGDVTSRIYRLTVEGELDDWLEPSLEGMTLGRDGGNTTLTGRLRDQAELQGLLQRVSNLGLTLLELTSADEGGGTASGYPAAASDDEKA